MSIEIARRILEASKQRARELRSPVSIAIVDSGGHLVLFERMMSPYGWATGNISIAKANTAVMFNQPTDAVAQWGAGIPGFASSMATMTEGKFIMAGGGWPIRSGGITIGGIGVSGGNAPGRDDEIARAGIAAVESVLPMGQQPAQPMQPIPPGQPVQQRPLQPPAQSTQPMQPSLSYAQPGVSNYLSPSSPVVPSQDNNASDFANQQGQVSQPGQQVSFGPPSQSSVSTPGNVASGQGDFHNDEPYNPYSSDRYNQDRTEGQP